ncbi:MAG: hypothetical protein ACW9W4_06360 [Candidatus Nitrosopumilus sp. bin_7KS]
MSSLDDFEADMLRLLMVWQRSLSVYKNYPKIIERGQEGNLHRHVFREYTVINLLNFLRVRIDLCKNEDFRKLDAVIKPLVKPILEHEQAIIALRNQYIAHVQEKGQKFEVKMGEIIQEHQFPTNNGFFRYLAGLSYSYCGYVELNFKKIWDDALKKYEERGGDDSMLNSEINMSNSSDEIAKIVQEITLKLEDEGYNAHASPEQIKKLREARK